MTTPRLVGRARLTAKLDILSGLHIGAGKDTIEIGGIDNPVIKNPHTGEPYVPGSSLKGKLRFLLEWAFGKVREDGHPWGFDEKDRQQTFDGDDAVLRIFGTPAKREAWESGPTRLIVRDAHLDPGWRDEKLKRGLALTEDKTEVVIDRVAGKAHDKVGPRQTERVPAGAIFDAEMVFRLYDTGDGGARDRACLAWLIQGLDLLEQDALGGSGSRGYGRVRFSNLTLHGFERDAAHSLDNAFRGARFNPKRPDERLLALIEEATRDTPAAA
jgi:CRISPR-associated protein Csm3